MSSTTAVMSDDLMVNDFITRGAAGPVPRLYGDALVVAARADERIMCLCADLAGATETDAFRDALPDRFVHTGIAEANMIGMAGGMARCGLVPFVHSFSVFATRRCYDQIAMQVAYPRLPVKIVGFLPGLTTLLGVSHQAIDDIALMRALPNMTVIEPEGPRQMRAAVEAALAVDGPVYLRMKRPDAGYHDDGEGSPLLPGQAEILREGTDGTIVACGLMVEAALEAATILEREGASVGVLNMATIKPLDRGTLLHMARRAPVIVTAENHSIVGGLGSAVAETLLEAGVSVGFARVGLADTFAEGGSTPYLLKKFGMTADDIAAKFRAAAGRSS
ncbi:transketolase family protein [Mangrovicella endophytica]|uniref:transketolase family protein n=1 Tax=Mangrovicella endophytica TaxID=2066697 RepID=UPI000C9E1646|nr:transketolase C-terminal domain-containing protein [Mangrovicella endophytica]